MQNLYLQDSGILVIVREQKKLYIHPKYRTSKQEIRRKNLLDAMIYNTILTNTSIKNPIRCVCVCVYIYILLIILYTIYITYYIIYNIYYLLYNIYILLNCAIMNIISPTHHKSNANEGRETYIC
jgi:hypothetical protein